MSLVFTEFLRIVSDVETSAVIIVLGRIEVLEVVVVFFNPTDLLFTCFGIPLLNNLIRIVLLLLLEIPFRILLFQYLE
jgi:hypothetical protein